MTKIFNKGDRVSVKDKEGVYIIREKFEQLLTMKTMNGSKFEEWCIVQSEESGYYFEVKYSELSEPFDTNEMLDTYNKYIELEKVIGDGEYQKKADEILLQLRGDKK